MAEFMEVAREKKRMCNVYHKRDCCGCPLNGERGNCGILSVRYEEDEAIKCFEETVMEWAKAHPKPIYPTWQEYLEQNHIVDVYRKLPSSTTSNSTTYTERVSTMAKFYMPIPDDIAEKLGLQPKEG